LEPAVLLFLKKTGTDGSLIFDPSPKSYTGGSLISEEN
jgi:hypothetical protein